MRVCKNTMSVNFENKGNRFRGIVGIPKGSVFTKGIRNLADLETINMWLLGALHHISHQCIL